MSWFCVEVTEACVSGGAYYRLCRQFQRAFIAAGAPAEMALFAQTVPCGDTRKIYFSPGSVPYVEALIASHGGVPCERPSGESVTMVFGVPGAKGWLLLSVEAAAAEPGLNVNPTWTPSRRWPRMLSTAPSS